MISSAMETPTKEVLDLREKGGPKNGQPQVLDKRLFMQFQAFGGCRDSKAITHVLEGAKVEGVLYEDINDPLGIAVLTMSEDPDFFISQLRPLISHGFFAQLAPKPEYTMFGRTYSIGYEPDIEDWLLAKPRRTALDPASHWAVWYPLRRTGAFSQLPHKDQSLILKEHGQIGRSFGEANFAHDIRLNCMGLDKNDNDFVIGLIGKELYPLSALIQAMRATKQTSTYMESMGPFFVGKAVWKSRLASSATPEAHDSVNSLGKRP